MKKVMFALMALVLSASVVGATAVRALDVKPASVNTAVNVIDEKVKIKPEELPETVKATLKGQEYSGWEISSAYKNTESSTYEVELKKATEVMTVKFDKDGKPVE